MTKEKCQDKIDKLNSMIGSLIELKVLFFLKNRPVIDIINNNINLLEEIKSHFEGLLKVYELRDISQIEHNFQNDKI